MRMVSHDTLHQLTFFNPKGLSVNCYLVEEHDGLWLIDTAIPGSSQDILEAAEKIGKPITGIILTHVHHDHIGSLDELKQQIDVPVYMSQLEATLLSGNVSSFAKPIRGKVPSNCKTVPDVLVQDREKVGCLLVISSPGHTPGSISLLDTRNHHLIAGDAFQTEGGIYVAGQKCPSFPFVALGTWDNELALHTARELAGYHPSLLAAGHGPIKKDPYKEMERAIFSGK